MANSTLTRLTTYDDYKHMPNDGNQYQIIGGELYMTPAPTTIHQRISRKLLRFLDDYITQNDLGEILYAPVDIVLSMTDVVQPDIVFVLKERLNIITKKNIVEAPDLVVEILSEHTETIDRKKKMKLYEQHGVKEYWIVDPDAKVIEQFVRKKGKFVLRERVKSGQTLAAKIIEGLSFSAGEVFG